MRARFLRSSQSEHPEGSEERSGKTRRASRKGALEPYRQRAGYGFEMRGTAVLPTCLGAGAAARSLRRKSWWFAAWVRAGPLGWPARVPVSGVVPKAED